MTWAWFVWVVLQRAYWLRESKVGGGFVAAAGGAVTIVVGVVMMDIHCLVAMILHHQKSQLTKHEYESE
jgi:hypothetical protein